VNPREQLSDYLLGELSAAEAQGFEAALADDPALRAEVERLRPVVGRLEGLERSAWESEESLPPLPSLPKPGPRSWWRRPLVLRPVAAAAVAAVLLGLGVAGGLLAGGGDDAGGGGREVALAPVEPLGGAASGTATFARGDGEATLRVSGLPPSRGGEFYELWLLNSPDDLVSLGSFSVPASGQVQVTVPLPADPSRFAALDVSVEPPDGNPAHSKRSVLRAPLAPA
jgi:anti-sigma-K factor RskA